MSKIQWTDKTWNPIVGCSRVSAGCEHCYAERMASRLARMGKTAERYDGLTVQGQNGPRWSGKVRLVPEALEQPLHWRKPRRIFVCSMSDLFHPDVPDEYLLRVFDIMRRCRHHTFQVLTKRPQRMRDFCSRLRFDGSLNPDGSKPPRGSLLAKGCMWLADHAGGPGYRTMGGNGCSGMSWVWLGTSVENQAAADERIPHLLETPSAVRFLSVEPLLGPVGLGLDRGGIDWAIVGGESGPDARTCDVVWIRRVIEQCRATNTACFVKQVGANYVDELNGVGGVAARPDISVVPRIRRLKHRKGGDPREWPEDLRVRQWPGGAP